MIWHKCENALMGFSQQLDGDLSLYLYSELEAEKIWKKVAAVKTQKLQRPVFAHQIHENTVLEVTKPVRAVCVGKADSLITDEIDLPIGVFTADCVPVLFAGKRGLGAAHAGWKGTLLNISAKTVAAMCKSYSLKPEEISAAIGPCIGQCCFEVGEEVYDAFCDKDTLYKKFFIKKDRWYLDLRGLNRFQLERAGINGGKIFDIDHCTYCLKEKYFSFRRQQQRNGSMFSFVIRSKR